MSVRRSTVAFSLFTFLALTAAMSFAAVPGVLRVDDTNPRWVANDDNKALVMTGSHHWHVYQDYETETFDWAGFQSRVDGLGHTFYRGWTWEDTHFDPPLYEKSGSLYDLTDVNHSGWTATSGQLRSRVKKARGKGLYTSVMFFQGWSTWDFNGLRNDDPWDANPYNENNNINGIDGDFVSGLPQGQETHEDRSESMSNSITALQEDYVQFVVGKLKGFANVVWEVSNESPSGTNFRKWQNTMVDAIWTTDSSHLIMISCQTSSGSALTTLSQMLAMNSRAKVIAPCKESGQGFEIGSGDVTNPEAAPGDRIRVADSDHLGALDVIDDPLWAWKYFLRGYHPLFMDLTYKEPDWWAGARWTETDSRYDDIADSLGIIAAVADDVDLRSLVPQNRNATTPVKRIGKKKKTFALYSTSSPGAGLGQTADGVEYVALEPTGSKTIKVCKLTNGSDYSYEWLNPYTGSVVESGSRFNVTNCQEFDNPDNKGRVLHVARQ